VAALDEHAFLSRVFAVPTDRPPATVGADTADPQHPIATRGASGSVRGWAGPATAGRRTLSRGDRGF